MSTIVAISTAPGIGGIGIIRMSGKDCFNILEKIFRPKNKDSIISGYKIKYGNIVDSKENIVDEVLVSYFVEPKSYTTENMCEINSHGGTIIMKKILELCLENGAILAEPGEFTKRAFLNGRIDLTQAEAVIDIINSKTDQEAKASINQMEGKLSDKIKEIRKNLISAMADIEASIDYPEYDVEEETTGKIGEIINQNIKKLDELEKSFENGKILREGLKTVILGRPNAGKSSLLNMLVNEERAIVTEFEGTTRDTIEEFISIGGIPLKIIDTAGIRQTEDVIEKIGVEKAIEKSKEADLIIGIFDISSEITSEDYEILKLMKNKKSIVILNKIDKKEEKFDIEEVKKINRKIIKMSTITNEGFEELVNEIIKLTSMDEKSISDGNIITNTRHKNLISQAKNNLKKAKESVDENMPIDISSVYIKEALQLLGKIIGEDVTEDIIKEIFSKFCLGK